MCIRAQIVFDDCNDNDENHGNENTATFLKIRESTSWPASIVVIVVFFFLRPFHSATIAFFFFLSVSCHQLCGA